MDLAVSGYLLFHIGGGGELCVGVCSLPFFPLVGVSPTSCGVQLGQGGFTLVSVCVHLGVVGVFVRQQYSLAFSMSVCTAGSGRLRHGRVLHFCYTIFIHRLGIGALWVVVDPGCSSSRGRPLLVRP